MIAERLFTALTLPAIIGGVILVALILAILLIWILLRRASPSTMPRPAAQPTTPTAYSIEATQPTRPVSLPPGMYLIDATGQQHALDRLPATLGRSPQSDLVIQSDTVSYAHARIYHDRRLGLCVEDLDSANGVTVDGSPTHVNLLYDGARLGLGGVEYVFRRVGLAAEGPDDTVARLTQREASAPVDSTAPTGPLHPPGANGADRATTQPLAA